FRMESQLPEQISQPLDRPLEADLFLYKELNGLPVFPNAAASKQLPASGKASSVWRTTSTPPPPTLEPGLLDLDLQASGDQIELTEAYPPQSDKLKQLKSVLDPLRDSSDPVPRPSQTLDAVAKWIAAHCILSSRAPETVDAETFLEQEDGARRGSSAHIAEGAHKLLQMFGIESRVSKGYRAPVERTARNRSDLLLTPTMKFAWLEIKLKNGGWTPLVITPSRVDKNPDESPPPYPELIQALVDQTRVSADGDSAFPRPLWLTWRGGAAIVIVLVLLCRILLLLRWLLGPLTTTAAPSKDMMRVALYLLRLAKKRRSYGERLVCFAERLVDEWPYVGRHFSALAALNEAAFENQTVHTARSLRQIYLFFLAAILLRHPLLGIILFFQSLTTAESIYERPILPSSSTSLS
ncbi:MAG: transglutaminase-like domain-containing protein, partial [Roseimicrobium sp.]